VAEKPVAEKLVAEKLVAEKLVAEKLVADKTVAEPVVEKTVVEKPVEEKSEKPEILPTSEVVMRKKPKSPETQSKHLSQNFGHGDVQVSNISFPLSFWLFLLYLILKKMNME
jgi:hypothetical protein